MNIENRINKIRQNPKIWSVSLTRFNSGIILFWSAEVRFMNNTGIIINGGSPEYILETMERRIK